MKPILQQFFEFCKSQDPKKKVDVMNGGECALAQFGKMLHPNEQIRAGGSYFYYGFERTDVMTFDQANVVFFEPDFAVTFGEITKRLRTYIGPSIYYEGAD